MQMINALGMTLRKKNIRAPYAISDLGSKFYSGQLTPPIRPS